MPRAAQRLSQRGCHQPKEKGKKKKRKKKKQEGKKKKKKRPVQSSPAQSMPEPQCSFHTSIRPTPPLHPTLFRKRWNWKYILYFSRRLTKDTIRTSSSLLPFSSFLSLRFSFFFPSPSSLSFDDDSTFDQRQIYVTADPPPNQGGSTSWACLGRNEKKSADVAVAELPAETLVPVATIRRELEEPPCYGLGDRRWVWNE